MTPVHYVTQHQTVTTVQYGCRPVRRSAYGKDDRFCGLSSHSAWTMRPVEACSSNKDRNGFQPTLSPSEELEQAYEIASGLGIREYCREDPLCWPRNTLYPQMLALTSPTSGERSVGIVRLRTQATEFVWFVLWDLLAVCLFTPFKSVHLSV
jgi:hypothetical protein